MCSNVGAHFKASGLMAKILDIAEKAGVSHSAVAAVLRGQGEKRRIAPATCERIRKIAEELGYQPNTLASSLRIGHTNKVGIISHSKPRFHMQRARAAASVLIESGYRILWQDLAWRPESEASLIR